MSDLSPLLGEERKSNFGAVRSVDDHRETCCKGADYPEQQSVNAVLSMARRHDLVFAQKLVDLEQRPLELMSTDMTGQRGGRTGRVTTATVLFQIENRGMSWDAQGSP